MQVDAQRRTLLDVPGRAGGVQIPASAAPWQRERGLTGQQFDQVRGACGLDCRRDYDHWHG
jgi:hypothetical protein